MMSPEELKVEHFMRYQIYYIILVVCQVTSFFFYARQVRDKEYVNQQWAPIYVSWWILVTVLTYCGKRTKNVYFLKIGFHIQFIQHIMIFMDVSRKRSFENLSLVIQLTHPYDITMFGLFYIPFCMTERAYIHVPISFLYMFALCFSVYASYYS